VLVLLALAGLLRPEAWVFSGLYWLYLIGRLETGNRAAPARARTHAQSLRGTPPQPEAGASAHQLTPRQIAGLTLLAVAAPLLWVLSDLAITGIRCGR
jgi:hypothetical protein